MKLTHTHRGHCQLCGAVQALDPENAKISKHGYTVPDGYFVGTCPGSDHANLHVARALADASIWRAREKAIVLEVTARDYELLEDHPTYVFSGYVRMIAPRMNRNGTYPTRTSYDWAHRGSEYSELREEPIRVKWEDARPKYQELGRKNAIVDLRQTAQRELNYADTLEAEANRVHLKVQPYSVKDLALKGFAVGDKIRVGGKGKNGYDTTIEAIEERDYKIAGWCRRGTTKCLQARFTRPARPEKRASEKAGGYIIDAARPAAVFWEPLRFLKKSTQENAK